jgi:hypothetical protein
MEPLTFKIITDADDRGVRQYEQSLSRVDLTGRKASGALKGFIADLGEIKSGTDVASSALNAFSRILGGTLIGTAVVVIGKTLVDSFNRVTGSVKEANKSVEETNKEISRIAMTGVSFESASKQADLLFKSSEMIRKEIEKINASRLDSFMAGITGSKERLEELLVVQKKQFEETQKQAIVQGLLDLERKQNADEVTKAIQSAAEPYTKLIELARQLGDVELANTLIIKQQAEAAKAGEAVKAESSKKRIEEETKLRQEQQKEIQKLAKEESDLELKMIDAVAKAKADAYKIEIQFDEERRKRDSDRLHDIEKQIKRIEERKKAIEEEIQLLIQRNAAESAGFGGTSRGPGQQPSSFEKGLEDKLLKERYAAIKERDKEYFETVREQLKGQGKEYGNWSVQNEIARKAIEEQKNEILSGTQKLAELNSEAAILAKEHANLSTEAVDLSGSLLEMKNSADSVGDSFMRFGDDFSIPSKNMIDSFLDVSTESENAATNLSTLSEDAKSASSSIQVFSDRLADFSPASGDFSGVGMDIGFSTEATLQAVLSELSETLRQLRSYAHAT